MKRKMNLSKRILSVVMAVLMVLTCLVFTASAETVSTIRTLNRGATQAHTVANWQSAYAGYTYITNCAVPMDGSNGNPDIVVPGLSSSDNYVPQGMSYWEAKNWVLISAYRGTDPSVIFALDFATGEFVAQFNLYRADGYALSEHVSGIAVSSNNLYVADNGSTMSYIPLSELDVAKNTVKNVSVQGTADLSGILNNANTSYASFGDGCLWTGNFYHTADGYTTKANSSYYSRIYGFKLDNYSSSTAEWAAFSAMASAPTCTINVPNDISKIQCATVSGGKLYIGTSYGRTNDSNLYIADIGTTSGTKTPVFSDFKNYVHLPMTEGLFVYGNNMYNIFESAAWTYNGAGSLSKNPTDVIWKFDIDALETGKQSGDAFVYRGYTGITSNKGTWYENKNNKLIDIPDTVNSANQGEQTAYQNIIWAGTSDYDCAEHLRSDKNMKSWLRHQPLVMVYDGKTAPRAPIMTVVGTQPKQNRYLLGMPITDNDGNSLSLVHNWLGSRDSSYGNNWDWTNAYNRKGGTDMKISQIFGTKSSENYRVGDNGLFGWATTPGLANIMQFNGSFADGVYSKSITLTVTAYVSGSDNNTWDDIVMPLTSNTPIYVVNYKPYVDYIDTVKAQYKEVTDINNISEYTEDSIKAYFEAAVNYVNFDLNSYFTSCTKDTARDCATNCGNGIKKVIEDYKTAYDNLRYKMSHYVQLENDKVVSDEAVTIINLKGNNKTFNGAKLNYNGMGFVNVDQFQNNTIEGTYGTLTVNTNGTATYTRKSMKDFGIDTFHVGVQITDAPKIESDLTYQETVTIIPADRLYFEDTFEENGITFTGNNWVGVGSEALDDADNIEFDGDYTTCATYSANGAKKVNVSAADKGNWPKAEFTFAGTGFDIISLTSNETGTFVLTITDSNEKTVKKVIRDTYYGYTYDSGNDEWSVNPDAVNAIYQVPVITVSGLEYGVYSVTLEARYSLMFDNAGKGSYDFYFDAVRVHNPGGSAVSDLYDSFSSYTLIKDKTLKSATILLDGGQLVDVKDIGDFTSVSPEGELYLAKDKSIVFDLDTENTLDVLLGMRAADGNSVSVTISNGKTTKTETISTATELYYSISEMSGTVTITNNGDGILSLTNLKVVTAEKPADSEAANRMSVSAETAPRAMAILRMLDSDLSINPEDIETATDDSGKITLTVKTSSDVANLIIYDADGNEITADEINSIANGDEITWTVKLTATESGTYTYSIQGAYENGYVSEDPVEITVKVELPETAPEVTPDDTDDTEDEEENKKLTLFELIIRIIKRIIYKVFGVSYD